MPSANRLIKLVLPLALILGSAAASAGISCAGPRCNAQTPRPQPVAPPLADRLPALAGFSSWGLDATPSDSPAAARRPGAFAVGNGLVFGALGHTEPADRLAPVIGPDYAGADFGGVDIELLDRDGEPLTWLRTAVRRVRGSSVVITEKLGPEAVLRTVTWAPFGDRRLQRIVEVAPRGNRPIQRLLLRLSLLPAAGVDCQPWGDTLLASATAGERRALLHLGLAGARPGAAAGTLELHVGAGPGDSWRGVVELHFPTDRPTLEAGLRLGLEDALASLRSTLSRTEAAALHTTRFDSNRTDLRDLLADGRATLLALRSTDHGVCVPMLGRRVADVRTNNGALLGLLRYGLHEEARALLEHWWRAAAVNGQLDASMPLIRRPPPGETALPTIDWREVQPPPAEIAAWLVLQHFWYWRASRDAEFLTASWPLIDFCLKTTRRGADGQLPFSGGEPWGAGVLGRVSAITPDLLVGDRDGASLASGVLFVIAVQAAGDMLDGLDQVRNPQRYAGDATAGRIEGPGTRYTTRGFELMGELERRYWLPEQGRFAAAIAAVDDTPHLEPVANANLLPLWVGWTFPTGEKSRDNLRNTLSRLWRRGRRIGTTATVGHATGDLQAMLLVALSERDGARRMAVFEEVLGLASAAGEWPALHDPDGQPVDAPAAGPRHLDPGILGINLDALAFAMTGIRHAAVPKWDDDDIRLELRTPPGADFVTVRGSRKDGRELDLFLRRVQGPLTAAERTQNDARAPEHQVDPDASHERLRFTVDLTAGAPRRGYYDVACNAEGTTFVRFLAPRRRDGKDLRRIEEVEFARPDTEVFLPDEAGAPWQPLPRDLPAGDPANGLVLTASPLPERFPPPDWRRFDTGRPFALDDLERALFSAGDGAGPGRRYERLHIQAGALETAVHELGIERSSAQALIDRFAAAGGRVTRSEPLRRLRQEDSGDEFEAGVDGTFLLPATVRGGWLELPVRAGSAGEARLWIATTAPCILALPDEGDRQEAILATTPWDWRAQRGLSGSARGLRVELPAGATRVRLRYAAEADATRDIGLWVAITDLQGLPRGQ